MLAPHLPDALLADALTAARAITDNYARDRVLTGLAPHLPDSLVRTFLVNLVGGQDIPDDAIGAIFARLRAVPQVTFGDVRSLLLSGPRPRLLRKLALGAMLLSQVGGAEAIQATVVSISDVGRWWSSVSANPFD